MEEDILFIVEKTCPICKKNTRLVKARSRLSVESRDVDLCVHYKDFNPYLYQLMVCENCGFAADDKTFAAKFPTPKRVKIWELLTKKGMFFNFKKENTLDDAINAYHTFMSYMDILNLPLSKQASAHLHLGWLYRFAEDAPNEKFYLKRAAELYDESLGNERYPIGDMTEASVMYLIAAIHFKLGDIDQCAQYLSKVMNDRQIRDRERNVYDKARDLWSDVRDAKRASAKPAAAPVKKTRKG